MSKKYHPDKLQQMYEAFRKGAQEKFTRVQEAYEHIQKEWGIYKTYFALSNFAANCYLGTVSFFQLKIIIKVQH